MPVPSGRGNQRAAVHGILYSLEHRTTQAEAPSQVRTHDLACHVLALDIVDE